MLQLRDISEQAAANRALRDSEANLKAVADVVRHIQAGSDPRQTVVDAALDLAQAAYVSLAEPTADGVLLRVSATTSDDLLGVGTPADGASLTANVFRTGTATFVADSRHDPLVTQSLLELTGARSMYAVPVRSGLSVTAVLIVAWAEPIDDLDDRRAAVVTLAGRPGRRRAAPGRAGRRARGAGPDRRPDRPARTGAAGTNTWPTC